MANKVTICGIDTSTLPRLNDEQMTNLLIKIKNGDNEAKELFINGNLRLVLSVIHRYTNSKQNPDDLFQVGCVGLLKAINNFDMTLNVKFSTYAVPMIIGEVRRFLRDGTAVRVSRSIRDTAYKVLLARDELSKDKMNEEPSIEEIANFLQLKTAEVAYALNAISDPVSIFDPVYNDGNETVRVMDQIADNKNNQDEWIEDFALNDALKKLNERERQILLLRYYVGKTQMEVSNSIGISQAQVSRLEKEAIEHMKKGF